MLTCATPLTLFCGSKEKFEMEDVGVRFCMLHRKIRELIIGTVGTDAYGVGMPNQLLERGRRLLSTSISHGVVSCRAHVEVSPSAPPNEPGAAY